MRDTAMLEKSILMAVYETCKNVVRLSWSPTVNYITLNSNTLVNA